MTADRGRGRAGSPARRPRLADVAAEAGVSPATASLVLRDSPGPSAATRRRVAEAAATLGYRADRTASSLARRRSGLLGVLVNPHSSFHAELVDDLDEAATAAGYALVLSPITRLRDEARAVETLLDFRCEALVLLGPESGEDGLAALDATVPTVVVGRRLRPLVTDTVRSDDHVGLDMVVGHLADLGHREIAFLDGGAGTIAADRRRGYRSAMRRRGLDAAVRLLAGDHSEAGGMRAAAALLASGRLPTAVACSNDRSAVGVLDRLTRAGVAVPGEVSVTGYDDSPLSRWAHLELTTVSQEAAEQARRAVAAAVERLAGRREPRETVLTPRLVARSTTGAPRE